MTVRTLMAAAILIVAAQTGARAGEPPRMVLLSYELTFAGISAATVDIALGLEPGRYDLDLDIRTDGVVGAFAPWSMRSVSAGSLDNGQVRPTRYETSDQWQGKRNWRRVYYGADGIAWSESSRDAQKDGGPPKQIPAEYRRGVMDLASGIVQVAAAMDSGQDCNQRIPVFDGKRRFDFVMTALEEVKLRPDANSAFHGRAKLCRFGISPVAGKTRKGGFWDQAGDTPRVWIGRVFDDAPPLPVRLAVRTRFGYVTVHLVRASMHRPDAPVVQVSRRAE